MGRRPSAIRIAHHFNALTSQAATDTIDECLSGWESKHALIDEIKYRLRNQRVLKNPWRFLAAAAASLAVVSLISNYLPGTIGGMKVFEFCFTIFAVNVPLAFFSLISPREDVARDFVGAGKAAMAYLSIIYIFSIVYAVIEASTDNSFSQELDIIDCLYFSVVTTTTLGYGDILPQTGPAKAATLLNSFIGIAFIIQAANYFVSSAKYIDTHTDEIERLASSFVNQFGDKIIASEIKEAVSEEDNKKLDSIMKIRVVERLEKALHQQS